MVSLARDAHDLRPREPSSITHGRRDRAAVLTRRRAGLIFGGDQNGWDSSRDERINWIN